MHSGKLHRSMLLIASKNNWKLWGRKFCVKPLPLSRSLGLHNSKLPEKPKLAFRFGGMLHALHARLSRDCNYSSCVQISKRFFLTAQRTCFLKHVSQVVVCGLLLQDKLDLTGSVFAFIFSRVLWSTVGGASLSF